MQNNYQSKRGLLILIGGAEDKKDEKIVLKRILAETQAKNIVIIPTASSYPRDVCKNYQEAFKDLGIQNIECFDIRNEHEAEREEFFTIIEEADLVFFGGGDQTILVSTLINTRLYKRMVERFNNGELHFAGTSAGAAAASNPMLYDGDNSGFQKNSVCSAIGFGFLENVTVDTHFLQRDRIPRLSQFLVSGRSDKGIGLDEDTGIIIYSDDKFEVFGSGMVTVLNSQKITGSNFEIIENQSIINFNNLRIGFLSSGAKFSIKKWSIIRPADEKKTIEEFSEGFFYNS